MTGLLDQLNALANAADKVIDPGQTGATRRQPGWPKAANTLSTKLKALAPNLRRVGIDVMISHGRQGSIVCVTPLGRSTESDRHHRHDRHGDDGDDDLHTSGQAPANTQPQGSIDFDGNPVPPNEEADLADQARQHIAELRACEICGAPSDPIRGHILCPEHADFFDDEPF